MAQTIISFKLEGFDELRAELYTLSKHFQRKGADAMANAGAAVVRDAARRKAEIVRSKYASYFSYIDENKSEFSHMTISGRNKRGMLRTEFPAGHVAHNIFMGRSKNRQLLRYGSYWRVFTSPQAWFARFLEYGFTLHGRKFPARSFMRAAVKENVWKIIGEMQRALFDFLTRQNLKRLKIIR